MPPSLCVFPRTSPVLKAIGVGLRHSFGLFHKGVYISPRPRLIPTAQTLPPPSMEPPARAAQEPQPPPPAASSIPILPHITRKSGLGESAGTLSETQHRPAGNPALVGKSLKGHSHIRKSPLQGPLNGFLQGLEISTPYVSPPRVPLENPPCKSATFC